MVNLKWILNLFIKFVLKSELLEFKEIQVSQFIGSKKDLEDGFIHFSGEDQIEGTLKKFYSNQKDLILLKVDTLKLDQLIMGASI